MISSGYWQPARQYCHTYDYGRSTYCEEYPARYIPPQFGEENMNAGIVNRATDLCMRGLGYRR